MKICFIADSSSLHVQRITTYFVKRLDDVLILSSARRPFFVSGAKTVHLLHQNESSTRTAQQHKMVEDERALYKEIVPKFLKAIISHILRVCHNFHILFTRKLCLDKIKKFDADLIFSNRTFPEGVIASFCHIRPLIIRTAGPDISKLTKYPLYRQLIRRALLSSDVIITQSIFERELLQTLGGPGIDPKIVNLGVDTKIFQPFACRDVLRDRYGLPRDALVIVSNRYLEGHYRGWLVVKAVQSIAKYCPKLVLLYVNPLKMSSDTRAKTAAISKNFPQIIFLNGPAPHSELAKILGCGDIFISFSSFDGISNSLLEAMACGLVPVVAELPQLHEWIRHGWNGYMVPQRDIKRLAEAIYFLYNNRRELPVMADRCVKLIQERAVYGSCMEQMRNLANCLIQAHNQGQS
jgi:L-malate glycosyltransferase